MEIEDIKYELMVFNIHSCVCVCMCDTYTYAQAIQKYVCVDVWVNIYWAPW